MQTTFIIDLPALWTAISGKLLVLVILTALDLLLGTVISLVKKEFKLEYLMHYVNTDLLPIFGWLAVAVIVAIPEALIPDGVVIPIIEGVVYGTVFLGILASVLGHLSSIGILTKPLSAIGITKSDSECDG